MADPILNKIYDKHYGNNKNKNKKGEIEMAIKAKNGIKTAKKETIKKERQYKFRIRPTGIFRISDKHTAKFGFKPKQELEIINTKPGEITIKVKNSGAAKKETAAETIK